MLVALVAAGCGGKKDDAGGGGGGGKKASCNTKLNECSEYSQANRALGDESLKRLCENFEGTFAEVPCPAENRMGACVKREGTKVYYQGYLISAADLEKSCTETDGRWQKP